MILLLYKIKYNFKSSAPSPSLHWKQSKLLPKLLTSNVKNDFFYQYVCTCIFLFYFYFYIYDQAFWWEWVLNIEKIALFFSTDSYIILFLEIFVLDSYPHEYFQEYSYVSILRLSINYVRKPAQIFPRIWLCFSSQAFHKLC